MELADSNGSWVVATALVVAVLVVGVVGFALTGFGPCGPGDTTPLAVTGALSGAGLVISSRQLSPEQRAMRARTIPYYLLYSIAALFAGLQLFIAFVTLV